MIEILECVLYKLFEWMYIVIEEVEIDNWGFGGCMIIEICRVLNVVFVFGMVD